MLRRTLIVLALFGMCYAEVASAQVQATILGVVTDESGAILPGVTVTATDLASGWEHVAITDERASTGS